MTTHPDGVAAQAQPVGLLTFWPVLLGPLAFLLVYVARAEGQEQLYAKRPHEVAAVLFAGVALALSLKNLRLGREPFVLLLTAMCFAVLMRECHFEWTGKGIYLMILAIGIWGFAWRERLMPFLGQRPLVRVWLIATASTYVLSQVVARRALRGVIPDEGDVHVPVEEVTENMAHLMLIVLVCLSRPQREAESG